MNDKREGTGPTPDSVQQIIAAIESIDMTLTEHPAAKALPDGGAAIEKVRESLREAIAILRSAALAETGEEAGLTKRRVKIKAESEVTSSTEKATAAAAKSPAARTKSGARGSRAAASREPANGDKTPNGSLLARLGAATETSPPPPEPVVTSTIESAAPPTSETKADATAQRLAQLEAEIADLTEAVTTTPTRPTGLPPSARFAPPAQESKIPSTTSARTSEMASSSLSDQDLPTDDDEIAEITIIGADGTPSAPASRAEREAPRIFREGPTMPEEEAEVEIRGQSASRQARHGSDGHKSHIVEKSAPRGRWRLFRGAR